MKKYILAVLFCGTFTFCSCSGFLDEVPKGQITTESYYRTEQHAISATNAIYNYLIMGYSPGGLWDKNYGESFIMIIGFFRICFLIMQTASRQIFNTRLLTTCR